MTNEKPFENLKGIFQIANFVVRLKKRPDFKYPSPDCYRELIEKCWSNERLIFNDIVEKLKNDKRFVKDAFVDENEYLNFVDLIENNDSLINITFNQQILKENCNDAINEIKPSASKISEGTKIVEDSPE